MSRIPDDDPRPVVHALVAWRLPNGDYIVRGERPDAENEDTQPGSDPLALEDVVDFKEFGWEIFPDYFELEELTRWEQRERARHQNRKRNLLKW